MSATVSVYILEMHPRNRRAELRAALRAEAIAEKAMREAPAHERPEKRDQWIQAMRLVVHCARAVDAELSP